MRVDAPAHLTPTASCHYRQIALLDLIRAECAASELYEQFTARDRAMANVLALSHRVTWLILPAVYILQPMRMRKITGEIFVRLACLPVDLFGALVLTTLTALWGEGGRPHWRQGILVGHLNEGSWFDRTAYRKRLAFTFGHTVLFKGGAARQRIWTHQRIHVDHAEAACVASFLLALTFVPSWPWAALIVWSFGYPWLIVASGLVAWLRGGDTHRDSILERAAYSLDGQIESDQSITRRSYRPDMKA